MKFLVSTVNSLLASITKRIGTSDMSEREWEMPKTPEEAVKLLLTMDDVVIMLKESPDVTNFLGVSHHSLGRWVRNNFELWRGCDAAPVSEAPLYYWYYERGLVHPDDMSGALLSQLHSVFHHNDFNLGREVLYYQHHWKRENERMLNNITRAVEDVIAKY